MLHLLVVLFAMLTAWPERSWAEEPVCPECGAPQRDAASFKSSLLVTVKNRAFVAAVEEKARAQPKPAPGIVHAELVGDVVVVVVEDRKDISRFVMSGEGKRFGLSNQDMMNAGRENLKRRVSRLQIEEHGPVRSLSFEADYNAALILLPEVWSAIPNLPAELVVAVPARDIVAFGDGADPEAVASLRRIARMPSEGYSVTSLLLQRVRGRWMVKN
ncbi:hypothetical protein IED13_21440 [Bosea sp. SSUT16]|jgi:hypothetical protein|uniref:DUF1444 family protein n=1 Tax=Bosea spartocytisi TaxID=2773451 RepID=A0A927EFR4_9HYPH|nr:hypothetical protein [Bosea spartocytisi]MBD3848269.1 hypothetical protein [Bosea spartocytisi]MCT4471846.1 hypothetical protein [Bosea spartocytisi]